MKYSRILFRRSYLAFLIMGVFVLSCNDSRPSPSNNPQRIVSLKPNLTEMLFALDAGDRVVGVTRHCVWPEEASELTKVGDYAFPDLERILSLQPDLVVTNKESSTLRFVSVIEKAGIPIAVLETRTLAQIYQTIEQLGSILGITEKSHALISEIRENFKRVREQSQNHQTKSALFVIQRRPLIVVGASSFINEVVQLAGVRNVVNFSRTAYPQISMEEVLAWQPDAIFDMDPSSELSNWTSYQSIPAVKNKQIFFIS
ncbi:MAG: ABC transporter substrate-binding protein, partial [Planctomycetota bacterium]